MIPVDDLITKVRAYNPKTNEDLLRRAYENPLARPRMTGSTAIRASPISRIPSKWR